jgi:putative transposase
MDERVRFIALWLGEELSKSQLCRAFGVSRKTGYKWARRYREEGVKGLVDRSRAARSHPGTTPLEIEEAILGVRREFGWGPEKLLAILRRRHPKKAWPSRATIANILRRNGLASARRVRRRVEPSSSPLGDVTEPNQLWSADFKGWFRTGDGRRCDPLTIMDGHSRYLIRCDSVPQQYETARGVFTAAFREYGMPLRIRTDNGPPFASVGLTGLSRLSAWWIRLGISHERIEPGKPQQNGSHERFHLTLKQEVCSPPALTAIAQKERMQSFRHTYNHVRPHQALQNKLPAELYIASCRPYPVLHKDLQYEDAHAIRRVRSEGAIKWRGKERFLSQALAKELVAIEDYTDSHMLIRYAHVPVALIHTQTNKISRLSSVPGRHR